MRGKRVVVAPLDWGLGHATRCIPIIRELLKRECEVWVASSGSALSLLHKEFPALNYLKLVPYNATYPRYAPLMIAVFLQIPKFLFVIKKEHKQLENFINQYQIDLVISDNRFGCWSEKIPSIFITHQLTILMPTALRWIQSFINYFNHLFIKKFSTCWVPDSNDANNLTGLLSKKQSFPVKHIGILSRFTRGSSNNTIHYEVAVILSGPEPQRTVLEEIIKPQLVKLKGSTILIRGVVEQHPTWIQDGSLQIVNFLPSNELEKVILQSKLIVARSGYSTVMDLAILGKRVIFIPTPGQTEQEYLAARLMESNSCFSMSQSNFELNEALQKSEGYTGFSNIEVSSGLLHKALDEALSL